MASMLRDYVVMGTRDLEFLDQLADVWWVVCPGCNVAWFDACWDAWQSMFDAGLFQPVGEEVVKD